MDLRRTRAEINDAVVPYIEESIGKEAQQLDWFYVTIESGSNMPQKDFSSLEESGMADPYCVM